MVFLEGTTARPTDEARAVTWDHYNSFVKAQIMSSVETKFRGMLTQARTPKDVFEVLKSRYGATSVTKYL